MVYEKCPRCGGRLTRGAPHDEGYIYQLECIDCGYIEGVTKNSLE